MNINNLDIRDYIFFKKRLKFLTKNLEVKKKNVPLQSQTKNGVLKGPQVWYGEFIEKTETVQEASTEKIQFIEKR